MRPLLLGLILTAIFQSVSIARLAETAQSSVRAVTRAVYPRIDHLVPELLGRNASERQAFTIGGGMAITYYKIADAIETWSTAIQHEAKPEKEKPKELKGF